MAAEPATAIERARISLTGLSVGDAFGETFFRPAAEACSAIEERRLGDGIWRWVADTVPFCLWVAARRPRDYEAALWDAVSALGDRDTTCAIVGGIVVLSAGLEAIPRVWRDRREPL